VSVLVILGLIVGAPALSQDAPADGGVDAKEDFLHSKHQARAKKAKKKWKCSSCHTNATEKAEDSRPGRDNHQGCDSAGCHFNDFYKPKKGKVGTTLCVSCHKSGDYWTDMTALQVFPKKKYDRREYFTEFSHKQHADPSVKFPGGESVTCNSCHQHGGGAIPREAGGDQSNPGHDNCNLCHSRSDKTPMTKCSACHNVRPEGLRAADYSVVHLKNTDKKAWAFNVRSKFSHMKHYERQGQVKTRKGKLIDIECSICHTRVATATTVGEAVGLEARGRGRSEAHKVCGTCHGGATYKGRGIFSTSNRSTNCTKCHGAFIRRYYARTLQWE
jgi:hypothetical protein